MTLGKAALPDGADFWLNIRGLSHMSRLLPVHRRRNRPSGCCRWLRESRLDHKAAGAVSNGPQVRKAVTHRDIAVQGMMAKGRLISRLNT
jgi:hypothetical protein